MKRILVSVALAALLSGCAGTMPPGVQQTRSMSDANGQPIDPDSTGYGPGEVGIGGWIGGGRSGVGFGMGW